MCPKISTEYWDRVKEEFDALSPEELSAIGDKVRGDIDACWHTPVLADRTDDHPVLPWLGRSGPGHASTAYADSNGAVVVPAQGVDVDHHALCEADAAPQTALWNTSGRELERLSDGTLVPFRPGRIDGKCTPPTVRKEAAFVSCVDRFATDRGAVPRRVAARVPVVEGTPMSRAFKRGLGIAIKSMSGAKHAGRSHTQCQRLDVLLHFTGFDTDSVACLHRFALAVVDFAAQTSCQPVASQLLLGLVPVDMNSDALNACVDIAGVSGLSLAFERRPHVEHVEDDAFDGKQETMSLYTHVAHGVLAMTESHEYALEHFADCSSVECARCIFAWADCSWDTLVVDQEVAGSHWRWSPGETSGTCAADEEVDWSCRAQRGPRKGASANAGEPTAGAGAWGVSFGDGDDDILEGMLEDLMNVEGVVGEKGAPAGSAHSDASDGSGSSSSTSAQSSASGSDDSDAGSGPTISLPRYNPDTMDCDPALVDTSLIVWDADDGSQWLMDGHGGKVRKLGSAKFLGNAASVKVVCGLHEDHASIKASFDVTRRNPFQVLWLLCFGCFRCCCYT